MRSVTAAVSGVWWGAMMIASSFRGGLVESRLSPFACSLGVEEGICVPLSECPVVGEVLSMKESKIQGSSELPPTTLCNYDKAESTAYVCCRVSEIKCAQYRTQIKKLFDDQEKSKESSNRTEEINRACMTDQIPRKLPLARQSLIANGHLAEIGELPHMVALGYYEEGKRDPVFVCGGTLISERWVLTAAHCFQKEINMARITNERLDDLPLDPKRDFVIAQYRIHEKHHANDTHGYHDIALVKLFSNGLGRAVQFSRTVYPACLSQYSADYLTHQDRSASYVISGWGTTEQFEDSRDAICLRKALLRILPKKECTDKINGRHDLQHRFPLGAGNGVVCAHDQFSGADVCHGDSGGPLSHRHPSGPTGIHVVIGVASSGSAVCSSRNTPGFYADVHFHRSWIEKIVWPIDDVVWELS